MISFKSIRVFFELNSFMALLSYMTYSYSFEPLVVCEFIKVLLKNYLLLDFITYKLKDKTNIDNENRIVNIESYYKEFDLYVISSSTIETFTSLYIQKNLLNNSTNIINDLLCFIPASFCFEVTFDFFHYISHFTVHNTSFLYKNLHKSHHKFKYVSPILTFYQHPLDLILTNSIPLILTISILDNRISQFMFKLLMVYKTFTEISGHSGKIFNGSSFIQCFWLPKIFDIELKTTEHDLHHTLNNCNYSKRFSLWDKFFGTFKD